MGMEQYTLASSQHNGKFLADETASIRKVFTFVNDVSDILGPVGVKIPVDLSFGEQ